MDSQQQLTPRWSLTSGGLKIIAMVTMVMDHVGFVILERILVAQGIAGVESQEQMQAFMAEYGALYWADFILRLAGRIAFPLFCFLLVEGFLHTRSRKKYLRNMAVFALVSEPFFDLAVFGEWFSSSGCNIFFTLALGLLVLFGLEVIPRLDFGRGVKTVLSILAILAGSLGRWRCGATTPTTGWWPSRPSTSCGSAASWAGWRPVPPSPPWGASRRGAFWRSSPWGSTTASGGSWG